MNKRKYIEDLKVAERDIHELEFRMRLRGPRIGELLKLKYVIDKLITEKYVKYGVK